MKTAIILGGLGAFATGILISLQAYLSGRAGTLVGSIRTGLWTNMLGGALAALLIIALRMVGKQAGSALPINAARMTLIAGALGIAIIMGISFSMEIAGLAAGSASVFLGQMALGVFADAVGWGGAQPIPLDLRRLLGLLVMGLAVYLLLPRG